MMAHDKSGTAFPFVIEEEGCITHIHYGMSLRDWFAGQALAGFAVGHLPELCASLAYQYADAMLAARKVKP